MTSSKQQCPNKFKQRNSSTSHQTYARSYWEKNTYWSSKCLFPSKILPQKDGQSESRHMSMLRADLHGLAYTLYLQRTNMDDISVFNEVAGNFKVCMNYISWNGGNFACFLADFFSENKFIEYRKVFFYIWGKYLMYTKKSSGTIHYYAFGNKKPTLSTTLLRITSMSQSFENNDIFLKLFSVFRY